MVREEWSSSSVRGTPGRDPLKCAAQITARTECNGALSYDGSTASARTQVASATAWSALFVRAPTFAPQCKQLWERSWE